MEKSDWYEHGLRLHEASANEQGGYLVPQAYTVDVSSKLRSFFVSIGLAKRKYETRNMKSELIKAFEARSMEYARRFYSSGRSE